MIQSFIALIDVNIWLIVNAGRSAKSSSHKGGEASIGPLAAAPWMQCLDTVDFLVLFTVDGQRYNRSDEDGDPQCKIYRLLSKSVFSRSL